MEPYFASQTFPVNTEKQFYARNASFTIEYRSTGAEI